MTADPPKRRWVPAFAGTTMCCAHAGTLWYLQAAAMVRRIGSSLTYLRRIVAARAVRPRSRPAERPIRR